MNTSDEKYRDTIERINIFEAISIAKERPDYIEIVCKTKEGEEFISTYNAMTRLLGGVPLRVIAEMKGPFYTRIVRSKLDKIMDKIKNGIREGDPDSRIGMFEHKIRKVLEEHIKD